VLRRSTRINLPLHRHQSTVIRCGRDLCSSVEEAMNKFFSRSKLTDPADNIDRPASTKKARSLAAPSAELGGLPITILARSHHPLHHVILQVVPLPLANVRWPRWGESCASIDRTHFSCQRGPVSSLVRRFRCKSAAHHDRIHHHLRGRGYSIEDCRREGAILGLPRSLGPCCFATLAFCRRRSRAASFRSHRAVAHWHCRGRNCWRRCSSALLLPTCTYG